MSTPLIPTASDGPLWDVWMAAFHAPALAVADELGLFAQLRDRPARAADLATELGIEVRGAEALAGLMAALGFLALVDGRFALTDVARHYLLPDSPYYWGGMLRRIRAVPLDASKLVGALRRGAAAAEARVSGELWRAPQPPPEALRSFTHAMHAHSFALARRAVPGFGWRPGLRVLDLAGGAGSYAIAAALHDPTARCTVADLPVVCEVAREYIAGAGVADRVVVEPLDMFADPWPAAHDAVFVSDIFHDWDDARCAHLAARAHDALAPGGHFYVHEMLLADDKAAPLRAAAYSVVMLFVTEGRQRTAGELCAILDGAGFVGLSVAMSAEGYALVAGRRR